MGSLSSTEHQANFVPDIMATGLPSSVASYHQTSPYPDQTNTLAWPNTQVKHTSNA